MASVSSPNEAIFMARLQDALNQAAEERAEARHREEELRRAAERGPRPHVFGEGLGYGPARGDAPRERF